MIASELVVIGTFENSNSYIFYLCKNYQGIEQGVAMSDTLLNSRKPQ